MDDMATFELKKEHIALMQQLSFCTEVYFDDDFFDSREYIRPGISFKRPFGNSDMISDVLEIAEEAPGWDGWSDEQIRYGKQLVIELPVALELVLTQNTFEPGIYSVPKSSAYVQYEMRKNFLVLEPALIKVKEHFQKRNRKGNNYIGQLYIMAMNVVRNDPWEMLDDLNLMVQNAGNQQNMAEDKREFFAITAKIFAEERKQQKGK